MSIGRSTVRSVRYGAAADHEADLHLPATPRPPVVCLLHGGFWRMPWGRDQMTPVAEDLASRGFAVWNIEYRRLGAAGGGWPGTMDDVALAIDHLARLVADGVDLDLDRVVVVGHSAGGHLALWAAGAARGRTELSARRVRIAAAIGLAPIADLAAAHAARVGGSVIEELLGGAPSVRPDPYGAASPMALLPLGVRQLVLHGTADEDVPIELSRHYAAAARAAGDDIELVALPGTGHMELVDPASEAHAVLCRWLAKPI